MLLLTLLCGATVAHAQVSPVDVKAFLDSTPLPQGKTARIAVRFSVDPGFHIQSAKPHDEFLIPTSIDVKAPTGITVAPVRFPTADELKSPPGSDHPTIAVYQGIVYAIVPLTIAPDAPLGAGTLELTITTQACDDTSCQAPETRTLKIPITIAPAGTATTPNEPAAFASADKQTFAPLPPPVPTTPTTAPSTPPATTLPAAATTATPPTAPQAGVQVSLLSPDDQITLINKRDYKTYNTAEHDYSLGLIVLFALVGGAILNVMPCVLPVIPLKVLSLVQQAHGDRRQSILHALTFSAGVISLFVALALVLKIFGLFYGQQFQSTTFLIAMVMFVIALALSMLNVWTINPPQAVYNVDTAGGGHLGSFTSGLMATLLATPCSAPYLGPVLAWALVQSTWLTALALGLVGVGMSIPYLLLAAFPAGLNKLPRAGRWSELLKQGLGIVMLGVAVYLLTLVPNVTLWPWILMGAVVLGLTCWGWGQIPSPTLDTKYVWMIRAGVLAVGICMALGIYAWASRTAVAETVADTGGTSVTLPDAYTGQWLPFNTALLDAALKEGRPVVVDWGADWCINCRSLEAVVLSADSVKEAFRQRNAVLLRCDLSQSNPPAKRLNEKLGGQAIPVLAIFSPSRPQEPVVLRDSYTSSRVITEVKNAH
jgi:thiol:disulfide interchange protein DsbD